MWKPGKTLNKAGSTRLRETYWYLTGRFYGCLTRRCLVAGMEMQLGFPTESTQLQVRVLSACRLGLTPPLPSCPRICDIPKLCHVHLLTIPESHPYRSRLAPLLGCRSPSALSCDCEIGLPGIIWNVQFNLHLTQRKRCFSTVNEIFETLKENSSTPV